MVSIEANGLAIPCPERIEGDVDGRDGTPLGEFDPIVDGDAPFCGANEKFEPFVAGFALLAAGAVLAVLLTSRPSNACLAGEEIGGRPGIEGAGAEDVEDEKLEGRGVTGTEDCGDGVGGTLIGAEPRVERGAEDELLPCCCQSGVCEPDCDVPLPL